MSAHRLLAILGSALAALTLSACNGSGGSDGPAASGGDGGVVDVGAGNDDTGNQQDNGGNGGATGGGTNTDDDGNGQPGGGPAAQAITVNGVVTDAPVPNAIVTLTVNGQSFQASLPTDAQGRYSVEIVSDDPDALVLCEAVDPNGAARFTALLNDFKGFQAQADDTGQVAGVDITNVTTAQYVLARALADDGQIDDVEELDAVSELVDTDELLELSAAIKVVVERINGTGLPEGIADTQELAEAIVREQTTFVQDLQTTAPGTLEAAVDLVVSDGNATLEWTDAFVPGVYVPRGEDDRLLVLLPGGIGYEQYRSAQEDVPLPDGGPAARGAAGSAEESGCVAVGEAPGGQVSGDATPEGEAPEGEAPEGEAPDGEVSNGGPCETATPAPVADARDAEVPAGIVSLAWRVVDGQLHLTWEDVDGQSVTEVVTLLSRTSNVVNVSVSRLDAAGDTQATRARETQTARRIGFDGTGFDAANVAGSYFPTTDGDAAAVVFLGDGTGYALDLFTGAQLESFTWQVDAAGALTVRFGEGDVSVLQRLADSTEDRLRLLIVDLEENGEVGELLVETLRYDSTLAAGPVPDAANGALLTGETYAALNDTDISLYAFGEAGAFHEIFQRVQNAGIEVGEATGLWSIDANRVIRVRTLFGDSVGEASAATPAPGTDDVVEDASGVGAEADEGVTVDVLQGLGEDLMIVSLREAPDAGEIALTRVAPIEAGEFVGRWLAQAEDGSLTASLVFDADGTGAFEDAEGGGAFEWRLTAEGTLRLYPAPPPAQEAETAPAAVETITLYRLADGTDTRVHAVLVFRVNGELRNAGSASAGTTDADPALAELFLVPVD